MSTLPDITEAAEEAGLRIVGDSSVALLGKGAAPALEEMVSRSLLQIQANRTLGLSQRGSELVAPLKAGDEREFEIAPGVKIVMCWIPPGEFLMGSSEDEEGHRDDETQHRVKITQGFWLAKTQTTQAQWRAVMGRNPSYFKGDDLPVESVSWQDICVNESRAGGFLWKLNQFDSADGRFDLPTESQWEYACRAGTFGAYAVNLDEMAWYRENSGRETHPVGLKKANAWGLCDMQGNIWEWCADWSEDYDLNIFENPTGPASGTARVIRGGSWGNRIGHCLVATRNSSNPFNRISINGFRVARSSVSQR